MKHYKLLPECSFVPVKTRRLAEPELLWQHDCASRFDFDPQHIFCAPVHGDPSNIYLDESRVEWADRYGGAGIGSAGGSGRCTSYGELQTKGVGKTPLIGHDADPGHASGTQPILGAIVETLFACVFNDALPFGAVPTLALLLVHRTPGQPVCPTTRALTIRPFVLRPAHFMRNVLNLEESVPKGELAPGFTRDTYRVIESLKFLAKGFKESLPLEATDPAEIIDQGLRELSRRLAWQFAASFAKRLPHGSVACSNFCLDGRLLDFGMSLSLPTYRRPTDAIQDPWIEWQSAAHAIALLRDQIEKYHPELREKGVVTSEELTALFVRTFNRRLAVEMAKMAGMTEDLVQACPNHLVDDWLAAMRAIWIRGGFEPLRPREANAKRRAEPLNPNRPNLTRILVESSALTDPSMMDRAIAHLLADPHLRHQFVSKSFSIRRALEKSTNCKADAIANYLYIQARRKNEELEQLERDSWFRIHATVDMMSKDFDPRFVLGAVTDLVRRTRNTLSDISAELPGLTGAEQMSAAATMAAVH